MSKTRMIVFPYCTLDMWQCMSACAVVIGISWLLRVWSSRTHHTTTRRPLSLIPSWFHFGPTPRPLSGKYKVGMRTEVTADGDTLRLFYPTANKARRTQPHDAPWLNVHLAHILKVIATLYLKKGGEFSSPGLPASWIKIAATKIVLHVLGCLLPTNGLVLPATVDAEPLTNTGDHAFPLIVFSHGLLGTGAENSLMCVEWASHGFRVAAVEHTDGSSSCAYRADGTCVPFALCPQTDPDKVEFRRSQVKCRSEQLCHVVRHLCANDDHTAKSNVALAGYSYGASTAFLAARELECPTTNAPIRVRCVLSLDGWYFNGAAFPPDVFGDAGDGDTSNIPRRAYPAYFLSSEGFANWTPNSECTKRLVNAGRATEEEKIDLFEILPDTRHANFAEQMFWTPFPFQMNAFVSVGACDSVRTYYDIVDRGIAFLKKYAC